MLVLDARFAALAIFCGLATQWAAPGATVHAAVISRTPDDKGVSYNHPGAHSQYFLPWLGKGRPGSSKSVPEGGRKHKVRTNDFHPSNPFGHFIDGIISEIKRSHGHRKRSHRSILIPSNHGVTYAVSHSRRADTPLWRVGRPVEEGDDQDDDDDIERRGEGVSDGFVSIMSDTKTLAYLFLTQKGGENVLNASEDDKTLVSLRKLPAGLKNSVSGTSGEIPVTLQIHAPNTDPKNLAVSNPLCATYNPNPAQPEPMTAMECVDQTSNDRTAHGSQTFLYKADTGVIRPTWMDGQDDGKTDKPAAAQVADFPSSSSTSSSPSVETSNSTSTLPASAIAPNATIAANGTQTSNGTQTNSTSALNSRAVTPAPVAQNVKLVFIPKGASAATADVDSSATDAQNSTVASSETTTTMTRTVTVFAAETASSSFTASDSAAAASQSANSIGVELVSGTPAATIASSASSAQALASASASSAGASFVAASVTAAPSSSINAAAVASSLAASAAASRSSASAAASAAALASASASSSASGTVTLEAISSTSASASITSTADGASSTFVAAVIERKVASEPRMTGVSTAPYSWVFAAEKR